MSIYIYISVVVYVVVHVAENSTFSLQITNDNFLLAYIKYTVNYIVLSWKQVIFAA